MVFVARSAQGCLLVARFAGALALAADIVASHELIHLASLIAQLGLFIAEWELFRTLNAVLSAPLTLILTSHAAFITPHAFPVHPPISSMSRLTSAHQTFTSFWH